MYQAMALFMQGKASSQSHAPQIWSFILLLTRSSKSKMTINLHVPNKISLEAVYFRKKRSNLFLVHYDVFCNSTNVQTLSTDFYFYNPHTIYLIRLKMRTFLIALILANFSLNLLRFFFKSRSLISHGWLPSYPDKLHTFEFTWRIILKNLPIDINGTTWSIVFLDCSFNYLVLVDITPY